MNTSCHRSNNAGYEKTTRLGQAAAQAKLRLLGDPPARGVPTHGDPLPPQQAFLQRWQQRAYLAIFIAIAFLLV